MKKLYFSSAAVFILISSSVIVNYLSAGQSVFEQKCARCHSLKVPDNYTKAEWKYNVERMAQRAGLTPEEVKNIIDLNKKK